MSDASADSPRFETIDWDAQDGGGYRPSSRTLGFLCALTGLGALFYYDHSGMAGTLLVGNWNPIPLHWLYLLALLLFTFYIAVPAAQNWPLTRRYWRRFRQNRLAVVALSYLGALVVFGTVGPFVLGHPQIDLAHQYQPPIGFTIERGPYALECLSGNVGTPANPRCAGTWQYPLGTNADGKDMVRVFALGARVTLLIALVAAMLIVPIATLVGTVAGYLGGVVDDLLMGYVDVQQTVPAFVVYVILIFVLERSLLLIILVFGLLSWGGVARLVRSDVLTRREAPYVLVARSQGASHLDVLYRHVLPNLSSTVITATTRQIPILLLTEAAIAYLGLSDAVLYSWGYQIAEAGVSTHVWWPWLFPAIGLAGTIVAINVVGDALRDTLDPRGER